MINLDKYLNHIQEIDPLTLAIVGTTIGAANLIMMASRTYKEYYTKGARQCSGLPSKEKSVCMLRAKMYATNLKLQKLKSSSNQCNKAKDINNCKTKMSAKIKQTNRQLQDTTARLKQLKAQAYKK